MSKILTRSFFKRPTQEVAKDLLGKVLIRQVGNKRLAVRITELEIYDGFHDLASHASRGETPRNKIMFEEGGYFYIYLVYGMYWMINITTGEKNYPSAILIRGGEVVRGPARLNFAEQNLGGPGKLSKFLQADKKFNGKLAQPQNGLWFEDGDSSKSKIKILKTPRIGVNYAGPIWSKKKWRFLIK